ncbi:MAG TPA: M28 family peptidase [Gemmatimonadales bacterium]|nr:M28 family peptidase [Gemmatimonadales bacterium]
MSELELTMRRVLALRREAGTPAATEARTLVADHLAALGYRVEPQRFSFHPSSLHGFPVFGAGLGGLALLQLPLLTSARAPAWAAVLLLAGGLAALAAMAAGIGLGWLPLGGEPREDANLVATRGDEPVRRWIVAHLDSKAQVQSMAGRLVAVWVIGLAVAGLLALVLARLDGPVPLPAAAAGAALAVLAGGLAGRGRLRGTSPGARDNGTGVAAALAAAEASDVASTGILITGAEEFGMVGARVFARERAGLLRGATVVNLDTIDQEGELALVCHDDRGAGLARVEALRLVAAGLAPRVRRLPVGIFTDSLPFARAGVPAVTIGRLTWRTLRTIHTPGDTPEGLSLDMAERVGRALRAD